MIHAVVAEQMLKTIAEQRITMLHNFITSRKWRTRNKSKNVIDVHTTIQFDEKSVENKFIDLSRHSMNGTHIAIEHFD